MSRCPDCRFDHCACIAPDEARALKDRLDTIHERAVELSQRLEAGECDTDDLIDFVENLAAKECP